MGSVWRSHVLIKQIVSNIAIAIINNRYLSKISCKSIHRCFNHEKIFFYRILQISSAVGVYSATSVWASTTHVDIISNTFASLNSLLVILAIAVGLPYFCFTALGKLTTPPSSRSFDDSSRVSNSERSQDQSQVDVRQQEIETMQYRGTRYNPEDLKSSSVDKNTRPKMTRALSLLSNIEER